MILFDPPRRASRAIPLAILAFAMGSVGAISAQDAGEAESGVAEATTSPDATATEQEEQLLAQRIVASLAEASERLREGGIGDETISLQQSAASDLEALLAKLKAAAKPSPQESESPSPSTTPGSSSTQGGQSSESNSNLDAAASSEKTHQGAVDPAAELQRRRDLAQSVWGHLPPRVQDELKRSFSERFVPRYEEAIRRYYEALARQPRSEAK